MSEGKTYLYKIAKECADRLIETIKPFCDKVEIAGSLRRKKSIVGDIEIVCIPKTILVPKNLFEMEKIRSEKFIKIIDGLERIKGNAENGKYFQRILPEGIKVDIFTATEINFGLIYAIRTGSAEFSHKILANGWCRAGYKSVEGKLTKLHGGDIVPVEQEIDLFKIIGLNFVEPEKRNI
jgi:DNA polymerase/3'-5' exonuclease PolX